MRAADRSRSRFDADNEQLGEHHVRIGRQVRGRKDPHRLVSATQRPTNGRPPIRPASCIRFSGVWKLLRILTGQKTLYNRDRNET